MLAMHEECEYCVELTQMSRSRFACIYGSIVRSRIVHATRDFVVMPTIGQTFRGSMLVVPTSHVETVADCSISSIHEVVRIADEIQSRMRTFGRFVAFEHGARASTGGGCGVYHAHLHVVPLPQSVAGEDLLPEGSTARDLPTALHELSGSDEYLLFRDTAGRTSYVDLSSVRPDRFVSQFFRRELGERFAPQIPWDWRVANRPEARLIDTVRWFRSERRGERQLDVKRLQRNRIASFVAAENLAEFNSPVPSIWHQSR
jgi:diadenosine tetraphosphate (Ap4A) HIT family hydrolase